MFASGSTTFKLICALKDFQNEGREGIHVVITLNHDLFKMSYSVLLGKFIGYGIVTVEYTIQMVKIV